MKPESLLVPVACSALVLFTGCKSCCDAPDQPAAAAPATSPHAALASTAPSGPSVSTASQPQTIRIKAGIGAVKDSSGVSWLEDTGFQGGDVIDRPDLPIANTQIPEIYRSERYAMDSFAQKLPNGKYQVKLHFCETFEGSLGPGERVFSFDVEGKAFKDFDVWVKSGGGARAYVETVPVEITDGQLDIKFTPQVENPQINAIEIIPAS